MESDYRKLNAPTLAVMSLADGKRVLVTVPTGAVLKVLNGPMDERPRIDIEWNGETITMFTADLQDRGTQIKQASAR